MENPIVTMTTEVVELIEQFKEAREDGKIKVLEWLPLIKESVDVIKATSEIEANDFNELTEGDIQVLATVLFDSIDREVKFVREDLVNVLRIAQNTSEIILRQR
jgi:hypothetical protein